MLFAGVNIDRCVFSTLQDANFLGYDCMLVEDSCQTVSPDFVRDAVLYLVRLLHGVVATERRHPHRRRTAGTGACFLKPKIL